MRCRAAFVRFKLANALVNLNSLSLVIRVLYGVVPMRIRVDSLDVGRLRTIPYQDLLPP